MKNKIIELDGKEYCIIEEINYMQRNFILSLECNIEKDLAKNNDYLIMEYKYENGEIVIYQIKEQDILLEVTRRLMEAIRK